MAEHEADVGVIAKEIPQIPESPHAVRTLEVGEGHDREPGFRRPLRVRGPLSQLRHRADGEPRVPGIEARGPLANLRDRDERLGCPHRGPGAAGDGEEGRGRRDRARHGAPPPPLRDRGGLEAGGERQDGHEPDEDHQVEAEAEEADAMEHAEGLDREHAGEAEAGRDESQEPQIREAGRRPTQRAGKREQHSRGEGRQAPGGNRRAEQTSVAAPEHGVTVHHLAEIAEARVAGTDALVHDECEGAQRHADERRGEREAVAAGAETHRARARV